MPAAAFIEESDHAAFVDFERKPFPFRHTLPDSPLLAMAALRELTRRVRDDRLPYHLQCDKGAASTGWQGGPRDLDLLDAFDALPASNTLIMLKGVNRVGDYAALLRRFLGEVGETLGVDMTKAYKRFFCTIIVASPDRVTPYHVDDSHNLLMQVHGSKQFYVFDGSDPAILTRAERDAFWRGNASAAVLTDAKQEAATHVFLEPGSGIHVPMTYPHWARNDRQTSVAVSINFQSARDNQVDVYAFNNLLRSVGLRPSDPGGNRLVDATKTAAFRTLSSLKHWTRRRAETSA